MRVEVLGGVERRRRWLQDDKVRIVEETLEPGAKVSEVARRIGIAASVVFTWRRQARTDGSRARSMAVARVGLIEIDLGNRQCRVADHSRGASALQAGRSQRLSRER
jgi:transposase